MKRWFKKKTTYDPCFYSYLVSQLLCQLLQFIRKKNYVALLSLALVSFNLIIGTEVGEGLKNWVLSDNDITIQEMKHNSPYLHY
jgi:hypothetical protein